MTLLKRWARTGATMFLLNTTAWVPGARAAEISSPLAGSWTLVAADVLHADGSRGRDYGAAPVGRLLIDGAGRYSLQIFKAERPAFAASDKSQGTPAEFAAAVLGASTHYGVVSVDQAHGLLTFRIEGASFPNWQRTEQRRQFVLEGDELTYQVPPRANGDVPLSIWQRLP